MAKKQTIKQSYNRLRFEWNLNRQLRLETVEKEYQRFMIDFNTINDIRLKYELEIKLLKDKNHFGQKRTELYLP